MYLSIFHASRSRTASFSVGQGANNQSVVGSSLAAGTCGGILIAVADDHLQLVSSSRTRNILSVRIKMLNDGVEWVLTGVYVPHSEPEKLDFLKELKTLQPTI
jgi:hypothetical protein